jgi:predicted helicase
VRINVTLRGIPSEVYDYQVNGKSAIEWLIDRYEVKVEKDSGIRNDPNLRSEDPRYIVDLVARIERVSVGPTNVRKVGKVGPTAAAVALALLAVLGGPPLDLDARGA